MNEKHSAHIIAYYLNIIKKEEKETQRKKELERLQFGKSPWLPLCDL